MFRCYSDETCERMRVEREALTWCSEKWKCGKSQTGTAEEFAERLHTLAAELSDNPNRIDYGWRRRTLANFEGTEWLTWRMLCQRADVSPGIPGGRQRYAAVWVWCHLTGGDYRLAPGGAATHRTAERFTGAFSRKIYRSWRGS